jgi:DinB superfamily
VGDDAKSPAECAADIDAARERLVSFAGGCTDQEWRCAPLEGDPRPVAVVVDHVADAFDYLAEWIRQVVAGGAPEVTTEVVDALNAKHAAAAGAVTQAEATEHLRRGGTAISALVASLDAAGLDAGDGRVRRLAQIAARHADNHRGEIEAALVASGIRQG